MAQRIPALGAVAERQGGSVRDAAAQLEASRPAVTAAAAMRTTPASQPAGKVLTRRNIISANLAAAAPILSIVLAAVIAVVTGATLGSLESARTVIIVVGAVGLVVIVGLVLSLKDMGSRYMRWKCVELFSMRTDCIVSPDDPDALFVSIVPLPHLPKIMLEEATDIGFLKPDMSRKEILFEGDRQRYRIPAGAVDVCSLASHVQGAGEAQVTRYYLHLRARTDEGNWENAILPRARGASLLGKGRLQKRVAKMFEGVIAMCAGESRTHQGM
jgi:hypothetical protein